ncbi:MAG: hypothetical protein Fur0034_06440 [Desulfuromonadia bacterium]
MIRPPIFLLLLIPLLFAGYGRVDAAEKQIVLLENRRYMDELSTRIREAESSILLTVFLFKTTDSPGNLPARIVSLLTDAARRGVDVTVLLEDGEKDESLRRENRRTARLLRKGGVRVVFDSPRRVTHAKAAVIDGRHVFIGSHNLTNSALSHNNELSVYIDSPTLARELTSLIRRF